MINSLLKNGSYSNFDSLINEIYSYLITYKEKINEENENEFVEYTLLLCQILEKVIKDNTTILIVEMLKELGLIDCIFLDFFKILILNEKCTNEIIYKFKAIGKLTKYIDNYDLFLKFNKQLEAIITCNGKNCFSEFIKDFIFYYEKINIIFEILFNDDNFSYINKHKDFFSTIFKIFDKLNFKYDMETEVPVIHSLLVSKQYKIITNILRILINDIKYFNLFFPNLLAAIKKLFKDNFVKSENTDFNLLFLFKEIEETFFNDRYKYFFDLDNYYTDFRRIIFDVLNLKNQKSKYFAELFDIVIKDTFNENKLSIVFSYLDMIEDYESFEDNYTYCLIERCLNLNPNKIDKQKEAELINKIITLGKDKFQHTYKLQTAINNLKLGQSSVVNLVGIPSHCYRLLNLGCKININDKTLLDLYNTAKDSLKFPENSKLCNIQGSIEFNIKNNGNIVIKANSIQFSILNYVGRRLKTSKSSILNYFEISEDLLEFLMDKIINQNILIKTDEDYTFNTSLEFGYYNVYCSLFDFLNYNKAVGKLNQKDIKNIIDCYIMRYLKRVKKSNFIDIQKEMEGITHKSEDLEINEKLIEERLTYLEEKMLIRKENNIYYYS